MELKRVECKEDMHIEMGYLVLWKKFEMGQSCVREEMLDDTIWDMACWGWRNGEKRIIIEGYEHDISCRFDEIGAVFELPDRHSEISL